MADEKGKTAKARWGEGRGEGQNAIQPVVCILSEMSLLTMDITFWLELSFNVMYFTFSSIIILTDSKQMLSYVELCLDKQQLRPIDCPGTTSHWENESVLYPPIVPV